MSTTVTVTDLDTDVINHRLHLADLRRTGVVNEANPLLLGVEVKVDAGARLTAKEYLVLWNGITEETAEVFRQHPDLLN